ncbi:hypothetical protein [Mucilaginibacter antarcticus]|uniref:hypothetical protein n=1 Tax=Mucilaginibacter antarcticus TaxID=1855725 RepID=UPI00362C3DF4
MHGRIDGVINGLIIYHLPPSGAIKNTGYKKINPVEDGFSQIMQATGNIRETMRLKILVDSLTGKKQLSREDSTLLDSALDRLSKIHQTLK